MSQQYFKDDQDAYTYNRDRPTRIIAEEPTTAYTARQFWIYGCCACITLTFIVLVSFLFFNTYRGGINHHKVDQMIAELNEDNTMQLNTRNMVSFSSLMSRETNDLLIKKNRLSLCYADLLRADTDDGRGDLSANADQLSEERSPYFYMLDVKLTLAFNVDPLLYIRDVQQFDASRHYMTIAYLISSSYQHFSTIKLVETGLDTRNKALVRTNEVILCSDNPMSQFTRTCNGNSLESLFVKNTKLLAMSKLVPWNGGTNGAGSTTPQQRKNTTGRITTESPKSVVSGENNGENTQYDIIHRDATLNNYKATDDLSRDLRMYNLVFYRHAAPQADSNARYTTFNEVPVLTIKPSKCK